jgi:hypothetical protein
MKPLLRSCASCENFCGHAAELEKEIPGILCMGSAYSSVRSADGLCGLHGRYLPASSSCSAYRLRESSESWPRAR